MKLDENGNSEMTRRSMRLDTEELPTLPPYNREALKAMNPNVCFVYGSLMDPATLQSVIAARDPPVLRPAEIFGYHIKIWGKYPALLDRQPMLIISGMAFEISEFEDIDQIRQRLQDYEGPNYRPLQCYVRFQGDKERVRAITFEWVGDESELKEGVFDLKDYQLRKLESNKS